MLQFFDRKTLKVFGWIEWVAADFHCLGLVEGDLTRRNTTLGRISQKSLVANIEELAELVKAEVAQKLPNKFGLILDGWTQDSEERVAVFACFGDPSGTSRTPILAIVHPQSEDSYMGFVSDLLEMNGKTLDNVSYLVGENTPMNRELADLMGVAFIGCANQRFNLAVEEYLKDFEPLLVKVNTLMKTLASFKHVRKLRESTFLEPVWRYGTHWSSTHAMLKRLFELKGLIDTSDPQLSAYMPSDPDLSKLQEILSVLEQFESVTLKFNESDCTLSDVRAIFDGVCAEYPSLAAHGLTPDAKTVHSPHFESGIVKLQDNQGDTLTPEEESAVYVFSRLGYPDPALDFAERALLKSRRRVSPLSEFPYLGYVSSTSNLVKRLFGLADLLALTDNRESMGSINAPYTYECLMLLKANRCDWDISLVSTLTSKA